MRKLKVTELGRLSVEAFKAAHKQPLIVVLDDIRSLYNVGSVFRTADAFRVERIVLCGITGCPPQQQIHKTALGAEDSVDWTYCRDALDAVGQLRANGWRTLALEQVEGSTMLGQLKIKKDEKIAIVVGNEVMGVRQEVVDACDGAIEIPQYGTKHSLNASCATSIVLWEISRQRKF